MQLDIEWLPTQRQMAQVERKRGSTAQRILARLREAPATSYELAQITHRFSARLLELRKAGHSISREDRVDDGQEWSIYTLEVK